MKKKKGLEQYVYRYRVSPKDKCMLSLAALCCQGIRGLDLGCPHPSTSQQTSASVQIDEGGGPACRLEAWLRRQIRIRAQATEYPCERSQPMAHPHQGQEQHRVVLGYSTDRQQPGPARRRAAGHAGPSTAGGHATQHPDPAR